MLLTSSRRDTTMAECLACIDWESSHLIASNMLIRTPHLNFVLPDDLNATSKF